MGEPARTDEGVVGRFGVADRHRDAPASQRVTCCRFGVVDHRGQDAIGESWTEPPQDFIDERVQVDRQSCGA